ncbi:hypothetical protein GJ496_011049 [Pomphorhynchus laevis]|nr:hypothetical protein GJ496_011049 [Pomphorhynchus laevis]
MTSINASIRLLGCAVAVLLFVYSLIHFPIPLINNNLLYNLRFLTYIDVVVQTIYYLICVLYYLFAIVGNHKLEQSILPIRDFIYTVLAFPVGILVCILFWSIYMYKKELMVPVEYQFLLTTTLNHILHTLPGLGHCFEGLTQFHQYPKNRTSIFCILLFCCIYLIDLLIIKRITGQFAYPFLNDFTALYFTLFVAINVFVLFIIYLFGKFINDTFFTAGLVKFSRRRSVRLAAKHK